MTRNLQVLGICLLALSGCVTEYKLVNQDSPDGGSPNGDGDGDGDGDSGNGGSNAGSDGGGVTGGSGGAPSEGGGGISAFHEPDICKRDGLCDELQTANADAVDVLFLVDNSFSMEQEQAALRVQLPRFLSALRTGDKQGDGVQDFPPAKDLHFGVITSDLGLPGLEGANIQNCGGLGDRGMLQSQANPDLFAQGLCSATLYTPPYIALLDEGDPETIEQAANDLSCIATVGLEGCGFEQPLESMLKAVWPGNDQNVTFVTDPSGNDMFGMAGPGFPNGDFLRTDANNPSLVALVMITDEEDCSSRRMDHFVPSASPNGLNTRCFFEGQRGAESNLFMVQRYIELFKMLRPGREDLVMFNAIVGVPPALVAQGEIDNVDFGDAAESNAFYDGLLAAPEMQERVDDRGTPQVFDDDGIVPSCDRGDEAKAYPPRRIVEVAKGFGGNGLVQSICQDDFTQPIDMITERIAARLGAPCLAAPLERQSNRVACDVYWELPSAPTVPGTPTRCSDREFLIATAGESSRGRTLCKVNQLLVEGGEVVASGDGSEGFYYDDFSAEAEESCQTASSRTRIEFTPQAKPPTGVTVYLNCD